MCSESAVDHGLLRSAWITPAGKDTIMSPVIFSRQLDAQQHGTVSIMLNLTLESLADGTTPST